MYNLCLQIPFSVRDAGNLPKTLEAPVPSNQGILLGSLQKPQPQLKKVFGLSSMCPSSKMSTFSL